ncbi:hypothetical protein ACFL9T_16625, partial [Thermodesulfobacteriota bacterium]
KGFFSTYKEYRDEKGESHYDVITIAPIYDDQGELAQILEASRDVTDRFKLEEEVRKSNMVIRKFFQVFFGQPDSNEEMRNYLGCQVHGSQFKVNHFAIFFISP